MSGFALGTSGLDVGHLAVNAYSLSGYWTHVGPGGWYTDTVLMGSSLTIDPRSNLGIGATTRGTAVTGSLEGGLPIPLGNRLALEPQAQLVWQHLSIDDLDDGILNVSFSSGNTFLGRLGVRLRGTYDGFGTNWQPWLRVSVLRSFGRSDRTGYDGGTQIGTDVGQTAGQLGAGVFATLAWQTNFGGAHQRTVLGNAGVRWNW